jgi:signal recognition particle subunit SRP54
MFDSLSDRLQGILSGLRGRGKLSEKDVDEAMREIRLALLEADVNFKVVREFVAHVKQRALGVEVMESLTPGQQVVKIVHEELTALMGSSDSRLVFAGRPPTVVLLAGLQGSGKTTVAAKLANLLKKDGKQPVLIAADVYRPAAIEQLVTLAGRVGVPVYAPGPDVDPVKIASDGVEFARQKGDVAIIDTAGRLHVDDQLMDELVRMRAAVKPHNILLVVDAMIGQDAVTAALQFQERVDIDGVVLTKLDGDARGGAALSVRQVTGKPIKLVSNGEKLADLDVFHPDRMASRILGMGDVLTLIEKAEQTVDEKRARELEEKFRKSAFTLEDFLDQLKQVRKMGPLSGLLGMLPGMPGMKQLRNVQVDDKQLDRIEAIVLSMTPAERRRPEIIDGSRRQRIARGSGTQVHDVNMLLKQFRDMQKLMKQFAGAKPGRFGFPGVGR